MALLGNLNLDSSYDDVGEAIVCECFARGYSRDETVAVTATGIQESNLRTRAKHPTQDTRSIFQQDASYPDRDDPNGNIRGFLDRLDAKRRSPGASPDIWKNIFWLQQRPSERSADEAYNDPNARRAYVTEIQSRISAATALVDRFWPERAPAQPSPQPTENTVALPDPRTITDINPNSYRPRGLPSPMWIACHTSESMSRVRDLNGYCKTHDVSYNRLVDDRDILVAVEDANAPWSAAGANKYAYHVCWTSSFAAWSRGQWLDPDAANDGINERQALRNGAKVIAYWINQSEVRDHRPIPLQWIGGGSVPPWGRNGICGHVDFGSWGGGHHDPGVNFPVDVLLADVHAILTGVPSTPAPPPPPVVAPDTNPDRYADWMEYQGKPNPDVDHVMRVQHRLKFAYASYGGHLAVDGDFGPMTRAAVFEFQRRSGLVQDGVVGPMTAAALKP